MLRFTRTAFKQAELQAALPTTKTLACFAALCVNLAPLQAPNGRFSSSSLSEERQLQFCVVGSGPAGFYTVSQLLKTFGEKIQISILERLPTPFGLVRSGVAPDHPQTKNVIHQFTQLGKDPRVRFFGNVRVGVDVSLPQLRSLFDGVVLAYGAESNRVLGIPGRHLDGIYTAREFVWWYNGHPDYSSLPIHLESAQRVTVLGLGNVALDCARILLQPPEWLEATDIAPHALTQLRSSRVRQVDIVGRRGIAQEGVSVFLESGSVMQDETLHYEQQAIAITAVMFQEAAFTAKELREVLKMDGIRVEILPDTVHLTEADEAEMRASRARKRIVELLQSAATAPHQS